ncbi:DNA topoisomerase 2-alpha isoform X4 [Hydra vulgaris]|uniref:DNA topoisomerase 2 n=1 Tax=Hydra vulgaris TaxID=6087 RepID=A0ABM4CIE7_HYDVU
MDSTLKRRTRVTLKTFNGWEFAKDFQIETITEEENTYVVKMKCNLCALHRNTILLRISGAVKAAALLFINGTSHIKKDSANRHIKGATHQYAMHLENEDFDKYKDGTKNDIDMNIDSVVPMKNKRLSVERIYQKKSQLEHIILRPDSYIGSTEPCQQSMWVWDDESSSIISKNITFSPGLYKIFDEIIVNAADNKQRDVKMNTIKVNIDVEKNIISVWNNGRGIPVEMHKEQNVYVPTLIFGHLLTSSNYDDTEKKVVGGRNGFGAKLCNIFSTKFSIETGCDGKKFKQVWKNNMSKAEPEHIVDYSGSDFTCVTFSPDLPKFKMDKLDNDFVSLLKRRAYDMAGVCRGVSVYLNGEKLKVKSFKDYVGLYVKTVSKTENGEEQGPKIVHEIVNPRWEICVTVSESGFQHSSFVNSIATTKGGTHVTYIVDQLCDKLIATVKKKTGKGGFDIKPFHVKSHLWVFVNTLIENPTFDSQTKENMTLRKSAFGSTCELSDKYIKMVQDTGVLENILSWVKFKSEAQLNKKGSSSKHSRLKGVPKLEDANDAGTKRSRDCTLIVTEGDSAKALVMAGLSVVGRDKYGVFPLRGKLLNVRDASHSQIMNNAEIGSLVKIIGLQFGKKYENENDMKTLRYGHLMIMADQDQDGSHIKGLVINFIHANWPGLLKIPFLEEFITPIIKASKSKKETISFFSIPEFEEWKEATPNYKSWHIKYYKGLGSSTSIEGKEYFSDMQRHRIVFEYDGPSSDEALILAFSKKCANERKNWLDNGLAERKLRREAGLPEVYLYEKGTRTVTYQDFINKELILFSNTDNERSIPSLVDGFKPGQRKVLFTCMKRNDKREVKVAQLAGSVAELSAYHHGEMSLMGTIVNLAQNFVGSNNLNVLLPIGQFGTRHVGGKDSASPRYIFTMMSSLTRLVFPEKDDAVLTYLFDDNQKIEPEWYCPIIPMCLVNGAEGIGTGYSTKIPNFDIRDIVKNVKRMINGEEPQPMFPSYKDFTGEIVQEGDQKFICQGTINIIDETTIEITELPVRTWTQAYKETVLDVYLYGNEKSPPCITDYKEYHTDATVKFVITMTPEQMVKAEEEGLHKKFKLLSSINLSCMVLFDEFGCIKKYESPTEIMKAFFNVRMAKYNERKKFILGMLEAECSKLENQARFILEKIEGKIIIENRSKRDVITTLVERGYASDPVKTWKAEVDKSGHLEDDSEAPTTDVASSSSSLTGPDFAYLLSMTIMSLSREKKEELLNQRDEKKKELNALKQKTPSDLWTDDLNKFCEELERVEEQEKELNRAVDALSSKSNSRSTKVNKAKKVPVKSKDIAKAFDKKSDTKVLPVKDTFSNVIKSEPSEQSQENDNEDREEVLSLADRLKKNISEGKKKQAPLSFKPSKPKKAKFVVHSDSDNEADDDEFKIEDFSGEKEFSVDLPKRDTRKKEIKKYFDDSDNPSDNDNVSEVSPTVLQSKNLNVSTDSENSDEAQTRALIHKLSPVKKKTYSADKKVQSVVEDKGTESKPILLSDSPSKSNKTEKKKPDKKLAKKPDVKQSLISFGPSIPTASANLDLEKKVTTKTKPTVSKSVTKRPLSEDESDPLSPKTKKTKKKNNMKPKQDEDKPPKFSKPKPAKTVIKALPKNTKKLHTDSEGDDDSFRLDDIPAVAPRSRGAGRAASKKVVYKFSSDEDDDADDDFAV